MIFFTFAPDLQNPINTLYLMEIPPKYVPALTEDKWYKYWLDNGYFKSVPDGREPYTIVIPPQM